jgi:hypothetical protein
MNPADPFASAVSDAAAAAQPASSSFDEALLRAELARLVARDLDRISRVAHEQALELLADDISMLPPSKAVRIAVYRSLRVLKSREPELRREFVRLAVAQLHAAPASAGQRRPALRVLSEQDLRQELLCATFVAQVEALVQPILASRVGLRPEFDAWIVRLGTAVGPRSVLVTYLRALSTVPLEAEVRVVLLRALHAQMLHALPDTVRACVETLLRHAETAVVPHAAPADDAAIASLAAPDRDEAGDALDALPSSASGDEVLDIELLAAAVQSLSGRVACPAACETWSPPQIIRALLILQSAQRNAPPDGGVPVALVALVGATLRQQNALRREERVFREVERALLDLVEMLFDALLADPAFPAALRADFLKLRVPYLRLVLEDRDALLYRDSAARRLLESLVEAALEADGATLHGVELAGCCRSTVRDVLANFEEGDAAFGEIHAAFERNRDRVRARERRAEQRVIDQAESRERLAAAWREVAARIQCDLASEELPALVHDLLRRPWAQYMTLIALRHGAGAPAFRDAAAVATGLRVAFGGWTMLPSCTPSRAQQAMHQLASIASDLRHGLERVGYPPQQVVEVWQGLTRLIVDATRADASETGVIREEGHDIDSALREFGVAAAAVQVPIDDALETAPAAAAERTAVAPVALQAGTALELHLPGQAPQRLKLCWRGVASGWHVFVNPAGVKSLELPANRVAAMLADGTLVRSAATPLVERALLGIADRFDPARRTGIGPGA